MESSEGQSLHPAHRAIRLHCFDRDTEQSLRSKWDRLAIHADRPAVAEVPDGLIPRLPRKFIAGSMQLNCVFDADNRPVPASTRVRGAATNTSDDTPDSVNIEFEGARRDGRSAFLFGANARHYGHFLLETLSRAWAWSASRHEVAIILSPPIGDFARSLCSYISGLEEGLEVITATTRFRHVTVASPAFSIAREAYVGFKRMCERIADRALGSTDAISEQPVYLSRSRLGPQSSRALIGEDRLERLFEREGFRIVHPQSLPIAEQIAVVNQHKWIVAPTGSACHTRLFSRNVNHLLMLTSDQVHPNYVLCDVLSKGSTHYADVFRSPRMDERVPPSLKPLMVDDDRLLHVVKHLGLVRSGATLERAPAGMDAELESSIKQAERRAAGRARRTKGRSGNGGC